MNTPTATTERRQTLTTALLNKVHRIWHESRGIKPCAALKCEHPWAP